MERSSNERPAASIPQGYGSKTKLRQVQEKEQHALQKKERLLLATGCVSKTDISHHQEHISERVQHRIRIMSSFASPLHAYKPHTGYSHIRHMGIGFCPNSRHIRQWTCSPLSMHGCMPAWVGLWLMLA